MAISHDLNIYFAFVTYQNFLELHSILKRIHSFRATLESKSKLRLIMTLYVILIVVGYSNIYRSSFLEPSSFVFQKKKKKAAQITDNNQCYTLKRIHSFSCDNSPTPTRSGPCREKHVQTRTNISARRSYPKSCMPNYILCFGICN